MHAGDRVYQISNGRIGTLVRWGSSDMAWVIFDGDWRKSKVHRSAILALPFKE